LVKLLHEIKQTTPIDRNLLIEVERTALRTKLDQKLADHITECVVDAVMAIRKDDNDKEPDLHMIEIMVNNHD
jgi:T-complex protein 1 subunit zeta